MNELYELKDHLVDELKEYGKKGITNGSIDMIDKLAHAAKNVCKVIESEDGHSGYYPMERSYNRSYTKRDSMGRYSRDSLADKLRVLMDEAPDDTTRMEIKRLVDKM